MTSVFLQRHPPADSPHLPVCLRRIHTQQRLSAYHALRRARRARIPPSELRARRYRLGFAAAAARQNDERLKPMTRQVSVIVMSAGACRHRAVGRANALVDQSPVLPQGGGGASLARDLLEPPREQLVDSDTGAGRTTASVALQLFDQLRQCLVGGGDLGIVGRVSRPGARRVGVLAGDSVLPGRHPQLVDGGLAPSPLKPSEVAWNLSWFHVKTRSQLRKLSLTWCAPWDSNPEPAD